jgi:exonuclease-1
MFRLMCILSGCDYLPSIAGMGIKNAHKLVAKNKDNVPRLFQNIRLEGKLTIPKGYEGQFETANLTFLHQRVWDPVQQKIVTLTPLPPHISIDSIDFAGPQVQPITITNYKIPNVYT